VQTYLFPDNTVFVNFAWVDRLDLLGAYLGERGRLVEAVEYEVSRSKNHVANLHKLDIEVWFPEIVSFDDPAAQRGIENIRVQRFGGREAEPLQHLGESQAIYALTMVTEYRSSVMLTDDRPAYELAKGLRCMALHTVEILRAMTAFGEITAQEAFELAIAIRDAGPDGRSLLEHVSSARDFQS
jgi:predicted nucleic acid-binding protein